MIFINTKKEIRQKVLLCRSEMPEADRKRYDSEIERRLIALKTYKEALSVLFFSSFRDEVDLWSVMDHSWQMGKTILLPKMTKDTNALDLFEVDNKKQLKPGQWGILEPDPTQTQPIDPKRVSLVIMPGVAFDRHGNRLGYGKGFYDRLLMRIPHHVKRIAVAYHCQLIDEVPTEPHDKKLDGLITERETIWFPRREGE
ncbi:MAG: 5-formyltetrahydrofolate cyclo-ligase [Bacilli bacterium]